MDLTLNEHPAGPGRTVVEVSGEIDVYTAPKLREALLSLVDSGTYRLIVDMSGVEFLDSTGLGVLVGGLKRVRAHDGAIDLVVTQGRILRIFKITGLSTPASGCASAASAIRSIASGSSVVSLLTTSTASAPPANAASRPTLLPPANPRFSVLMMTRAAGNCAATAAGVSSVEALSTTYTVCGRVCLARDARQSKVY